MSKFLLCLHVSVCQSAHFNMSAIQYASQSKTRAGFICASFSMSSQPIFQNFNMSASRIAVNSSHERVFIMSASFSMSVTARFVVC